MDQTMEGEIFTDATGQFIDELYAKTKSDASLADYRTLVTSLLQEGEEYDARILAFDAATQSRFGKTFEELKSRVRLASQHLERDKKRSRKHANNLAVVGALWSRSIIGHYNWSSASLNMVDYLRRCAQKHPHFQDSFVPYANAALIARHELSFTNQKVPSLREKSTLELRDLRAIDDGEVVPDNGQLELWMTTSPANIRISGKTLLEWRGEHAELYLLDKDCHGLATIKSSRLTQLFTPTATATQAATREKHTGINATSKPEFSVLDMSSSEQSRSHETDSPNSSSPLFVQQSPAQAYYPFEFDDDEILDESGSHIRNRDHDTHEEDVPDGVEGDEARFTSAPGSRVDGSETGSPDEDLLESNEEELGCTKCNGKSENWSEVEMSEGLDLDQEWQEIRSDEASSCQVQGLTEQLSSLTGERDEVAITISSPPFAVAGQRSSWAQKLHNRHRERLLEYVVRLQRDADSQGALPATKMRARWLGRQTRWATESKTLDRKADVLCCSTDEFCRLASNGKRFDRLVLLKEDFSDSEMHSCRNFCKLLEQMFGDVRLEITDFGGPGTTRSSDLITAVDMGPHESGRPMRLQIPSVTHAHRPSFTYLPRYRLLDSLTARSVQLAGERHIQNFRGDVNFNVLELEGAYSGARTEILTGKWIRNLDGLMLWLIVPEAHMEGQWETFERLGEGWDPAGRERLIILEKNDVLFMPPGLRVVHATHALETSLMEGGIVWDYLDLVPTLNAAARTFNSGTSDKVSDIMSPLTTALIHLVDAGTDRFLSSGTNHIDFIDDFHTAIARLRQLGVSRSTPDMLSGRNHGRSMTDSEFATEALPSRKRHRT